MTGTAEPVVDVLIAEGEIAERVTGLAKDIARSAPADLLIVVILKGSFVFAADLIRALDRAGATPSVDFMTLSSYGAGMRSKGAVTLSRDISEDVTGRHVLIVDDILESGRTLLFARDLLTERGAVSVKTCLLLDKTEKREVAIEADFTGFEIGDQFVIGYGLDLAHRYRGLPYIGVVRSA
jgi:hypoxanthine phosphoribosyltransferase